LLGKGRIAPLSSRLPPALIQPMVLSQRPHLRRDTRLRSNELPPTLIQPMVLSQSPQLRRDKTAWQGREEGSAFVKTTARQGGVSAKTMAGGKMYLAKRLIDIILAS
jgi:hypothetical protein